MGEPAGEPNTSDGWAASNSLFVPRAKRRPVGIVKTGLTPIPAIRGVCPWGVLPGIRGVCTWGVLFSSGMAWETSGAPWGTEKRERLLVVATASKRLSASKASGGAGPGGALSYLSAEASGMGMPTRSWPDSASKRKIVVGIWIMKVCYWGAGRRPPPICRPDLPTGFAHPAGGVRNVAAIIRVGPQVPQNRDEAIGHRPSFGHPAGSDIPDDDVRSRHPDDLPTVREEGFRREVALELAQRFRRGEIPDGRLRAVNGGDRQQAFPVSAEDQPASMRGTII